MTQEPRERGLDPAALSAQTPGVRATSENGHDPAAMTMMTCEDRQTAEYLSASLRGLRTARPGFQDELERRLLASLSEPARPWWQAFVPGVAGRAQARPRVAGLRRLPRRSVLGLAAASALALLAASVSLPLIGAPEVSALEILEKAQANVENPMLAGVKSYHLTAKIWGSHGPIGRAEGQATGPRESTTEQWFVSPDRMRTETRSTGKDGKPVLTGFMLDGSQAKHYATEGADDLLMVSVFAVPVSASGPRTEGAVQETVIVTAGTSSKPSASGTPGSVSPPGTAGVRPAAGTSAGGPTVAGQRVEAKPAGVAVAIHQRRDGTGEGEGNKPEQEIIVLGENCPEPKRTGEGSVAGRPVFVIENDFSSCLPADAAADLPGRHVRWVDQKTYLPLKMEMYGKNGALVDRYEVTAIEYDLDIPGRVFTEIPAGTSVRDPKSLPDISIRKP